MEDGRKYTLVSFNGTTTPEDLCDPSENYWLLIGQSGEIVDTSEEPRFGRDDRVLFRFDQNLKQYGLECHNSVADALWILKTDLERSE